MSSAGNWKEMFHASENDDLELVRYHLSMGVDPDYQHPEYMTGALLESIRKGNLEVAQLLLEHNADPCILKDFTTETPMSIAVSQQNKSAIFLLNQYLPEKDRNHKFGNRNNILITNATQGSGEAIAKNLLIEGQKVVITTTNKNAGESIVQDLKSETRNPNISYVQGSLSDIQNCNSLINTILSKHPDINVLINNPNDPVIERILNTDGLEANFMNNYIAPYLLSTGLLSTLKNNTPARIININSRIYNKGSIDINHISKGAKVKNISNYANSMLCNAMFTIDFAKEIEGSGVTINAIDPGRSNTSLHDANKISTKIIKLLSRFSRSADIKNGPTTWLAIDKDLTHVNGKYYNRKNRKNYSGEAQNEQIRNELRIITEDILSKYTALMAIN